MCVGAQIGGAHPTTMTPWVHRKSPQLMAKDNPEGKFWIVHFREYQALQKST
jgi:hypothetical protein